MIEPVRIVVQDRRRLVREGLADLLAAEPGIEVVAMVTDAEELASDLGRVDVVLVSAADGPRPRSAIRYVTFTGSESVGSLVEAVRGTAPTTIHGRPTATTASGGRLSSREVQVLRGLSGGLSTGQVAAALGIARKSVDNHKQRIFVKLGAQNSAHAVVLALETGVLDPAGESGRGLAG